MKQALGAGSANRSRQGKQARGAGRGSRQGLTTFTHRIGRLDSSVFGVFCCLRITLGALSTTLFRVRVFSSTRTLATI